MIYLSSQPGRRYVEGYKEELYMRKMKISSWRLLEPSNSKLEVQFRKGKLSIQVDRGDPVRPVGRRRVTRNSESGRKEDKPFLD